MSRIRLTIDELALKGFEGADGRALVHGIRSQSSPRWRDTRRRKAQTCEEESFSAEPNLFALPVIQIHS